MRNLLLAAGLATMLAAPLTASAQAPATTAPGAATTTPGTAATAAPGLRVEANQIRAKQLMDRDIYTTDNVEIGEIEDLVIDPAQGRVVLAVIEVETRLGLTSKYVAVPLNQLRLTPGERRITIQMTREQINALPAITYND
ncbi:PRC-barrel domain-containing protein [Roseomonas sp. BN140053]|uniref:PRC-barrel domain-containing protein n=1 Tax=Roseomonas sp. BN140053 TaxID=3391898 RepID=UPI0039EA04A2